MRKLIFILTLIFVSFPAFAQKKMSETGYGAQNYLINGNWDFWQRGTSMTQATTTSAGTGVGYGAPDRWFINNWGTLGTFTFSRQAMSDGNFGATYFARWSQTVAGTADRDVFQSVENVRVLAGKTVTISSYVKSDVGVAFRFAYRQHFGSGGSPSASGAYTTCGASSITTTSSWVRYTATCSIPSIAGKTVGTNEDSKTEIHFLISGTTFNFDIGPTMLNIGDRAAPFALAGGDVAGELAKCMRYFEKSYELTDAPGAVTSGYAPAYIGTGHGGATCDPVQPIYFKVPKRSNTYTLTAYRTNGTSGAWSWSADAGTTCNITASPFGGAIAKTTGAIFNLYANGGVSGCSFAAGVACVAYGHWVADAELQ